MAIRKTAQAAKTGQEKGTKGKSKEKAPKAEATILDDTEDETPEVEEETEDEEEETVDEAEDDELAPLPPAAPLPKKGKASRSGMYIALVTIRNGEDVHKAGSTFALPAGIAAEYLKMGAIRAA